MLNDSGEQVTQSRNPIRRSLSERQQPLYNKLTTNSGYSLDSSMDRNNTGNSSCSVNRSLQSSNNNNNNAHDNVDAILNFKDTMALRLRSNRNDSRDLFEQNLASTVNNTNRPKQPPPPPPPTVPVPAQLIVTEGIVEEAAAHATAAAAVNEVARKEFTATTMSNADALPLSPTGQTQQNAVDKDIAAAGLTTSDANNTQTTTNLTSGSNIEAVNGFSSQKQQIQCKNESVAFQRQHQLQQQHHQANITNQSNNSTNDSTFCQEINKANINDKKESKQQTILQNNYPQQQNDNNTPNKTTNRPTSLFSTSTPKTTMKPNGVQSSVFTPQQRTVVRVAPFNKTTSEVHRLKISHTDADSNCASPTSPFGHQYNVNGSPHGNASNTLICDMYAQRKTSILINGDDCYSTMNLSCDASTPLYQSSVVVADYSSAVKSTDNTNGHAAYDGLKVTTTSNTVTINVSSPRSAEEELIYQHNKINTMLSRQAKSVGGSNAGLTRRAIIPIKGTTEVNLQRSASSTSSTSTSSITSTSSSASGSGSGSHSGSIPKRGRTLIRLDYEKEKPQQQQLQQQRKEETTLAANTETETTASLVSHEQELLKILRNPVEAVKRNLVPHVCGRYETQSERENVRNKKMKEAVIETTKNLGKEQQQEKSLESPDATILRSKSKPPERSSFIAKLLEDPMLSQVADGLETEIVAELIENSLKRLKESRSAIDISGTKDNDDVNRLINLSLQKIKEERQATATQTVTTNNDDSNTHLTVPTKDDDRHSNRGSISSANSFASANNYEMFDFDANESDCYQSCSSEITSPGDDDSSSATTRSKFYQMLVDATLAEIELSTNIEDLDEHHYESIRNNGDPIYEEITDVPPPLPLTAPPLSDELDKKAARSIFEGASKYDILSYLVDAKERGVAREETFDYPLNCSNPIIIEEEACDTLSDLGKRKQRKDMSSRASVVSDSSEDNQSNMSSLSPPPNTFMCGSNVSLLQRKCASSDIERNDSGVGSETSKSSRSKYQHTPIANTNLVPSTSPIHLCEDCDGPVETQVTDSGVMFAPLVCRKCGKKRIERKEIITEIVETEEKYGRDLQIILEEFCHPMLVAGLLTQEQLSAIFLNTEELLENNQTLAERMRDALDIALEQGDDDLLTVNIGRIFLDFTQMLHAFESYCVRQAGASLLLANLEKEKELLRIFLKVSQMENAVLRRMNLNSFLMVPVQRVTKYPLLLARLYKVTPAHLEGRDMLKQAQEKIELHLNHINQEAKDVPTKLWRRISSSSPNRRASCEIDMINIKLRKMAIDVLEWNHDEVRFAMEGKLLYTQPTDSNWKKARTIKLTPVNALLVTNGKPSANYKAEKVMSDKLNFPKHTGIREASLLVVKEKCGRYTLIREPLYLDRCVVCSEADWDDYFEVQEISSKDTFIFKAEDGVRTKQWYTQLQYHAQGMGAWRKRRNALANIMINGMLARS
ncbi:probable serine/threonine-protein kinase DDB_G0282963 [Teleopsis dalmanni]|uniref:probable serine/threonine-protein kinase DDB_G0282963 n=1 Tax=Teleopsis dalmanni TaxID=139649 RepID=UPI0018CEDE0D|nr:probable serine/threonine-protein kinase DDB_G0282963 [Teleopsis dalmanni]